MKSFYLHIEWMEAIHHTVLDNIALFYTYTHKLVLHPNKFININYTVNPGCPQHETIMSKDYEYLTNVIP